MDCAATPALPGADSGRIRPTRTWPAPSVIARRRQRQDQADANLARAERGGRRRLGRLRQRRAAEKLGIAGAGGERGGGGGDAQRGAQAASPARQRPLLSSPHPRHGGSPRDSSVSVLPIIGEFVLQKLRW